MPLASLITRRLYLRPFEVSDTDALATLAADPRVMQYVGTGPESRAVVKAGLQRAITRWQTEQMSWWAVFERQSHQFVGRCCLQRCGNVPDIEIGYALATPYWGLGYADEAVRGILDYGFNLLNLPSVIALTDIRNQASWRLLERFGFLRERTIHPRHKDLYVYRLTKERDHAAY